MVILRQKDAVLEADVDYNEIYDPWSEWSRCKRRCKQVRMRNCIKHEICQSTILKEERVCNSDDCIVPQVDESRHQNSEDKRARSRFRILYHLQNYVYSHVSSLFGSLLICH